MSEIAMLLSALNVGSILAGLAAWRKASHASSELSHNHGTSTKDSIARIEARQDATEREIVSLGHQVGELNVHLNNYFQALTRLVDE